MAPSPQPDLPLPLLGQLGAAKPKEDEAPPTGGTKRGPGRPRKDSNSSTTSGGTTAAGSASTAAASGSTASKRGPGRPPNQPKLVERIEAPLVALGGTIAVSAGVRGWDTVAKDGASIVAAAEPIALALDRVCAENPKVRKKIEQWLTASAWTELVIALGALGVDIAGNHGLLDRAARRLAEESADAEHAPDAADAGPLPGITPSRAPAA